MSIAFGKVEKIRLARMVKSRALAEQTMRQIEEANERLNGVGAKAPSYCSPEYKMDLQLAGVIETIRPENTPTLRESLQTEINSWLRSVDI